MLQFLSSYLLIGWYVVVTLVAIVLWKRLRNVEQDLEKIKARLKSSISSPPVDSPVVPDTRQTNIEPESPTTESQSAQNNGLETGPEGGDIRSENWTLTRSSSVVKSIPKSEKLKSSNVSIEGKMATRWLVWLGAVTLALGSVFLVRYSVDQGLLIPELRIVIGILVGTGLIIWGEWFRRRPLQQAIAAIQPNYIPTALSGAGVCAVYISIFAAQSLYGMISPFWSFVFLALVSLVSVGLSLMQGPFLAVLGVAGGFLVPALLSSGTPSAWGLFGYIFVVTSSGLAVTRYMNWPWLIWVTLAGTLLWPVLWMVELGGDIDPLPISGYLIAALAVFYLLGPSTASAEKIDFRKTLRLDLSSTGVRSLILPAIGISFCFFVLSNLVLESLTVTIAIGAVSLILVGGALRDARLNLFMGLAGLLVVSVLLTWDMPLFVDVRPVLVLGSISVGPQGGSVIPSQLHTFIATSMAFAILMGLGLFYGSGRVQHPAFWTSVSAAVPLIILANAYWKITEFDVHIGWGAAGLVLAGIYAYAVSYFSRTASSRDVSGQIASYAVATIASVALAMTMSLQEAWLTAAISLIIPGVAVIYARLKLPALRHVAAILAGAVIARLALNPSIFDYPIGDVSGMNWILYGYGIPTIAFYWAARKFREDNDDRVVGLLESGACIFAVLLVSLEIRHFVNDGSIDVAGYSLFEQSLQSIAWLAGAYGLYKQNASRGGIIQTWSFRVLVGLAAAQILLLQVLVFNPLLTGSSVWEGPVFNLLMFAYGLPVIFALLFVRTARQLGDTNIARFSGAVAFILLFMLITLETRQMFQGEYIKFGPTSNAEWYAYSIVWLVYAGCLLALGIVKQSKELRYVSLALVLLTIGKVFLWDMAALEGLFRVGSFFVLGGCLIGIGYLYQRFLREVGE